MKNVNKNVKLYILLVALSLIIVSVIVLWNDTENNVNLIFNSLFINIGINVMSALLLIYFLEERDKKNKEQEESQRQHIIYRKIAFVIKDFNILIKNMYKATMSQKINGDNQILDNLYYDIDKLYNQIINVKLYKKGYLCDFNAKDIFKPVEYNWHQCFVIEIKKLFDSIDNIVNIYSTSINSNVLEKLENITSYKKSLFLIANPIIPIIPNISKSEDTNNAYKMLFEFSQLKNILINISGIINIINKNNKENSFKLNIDDFNSENSSPQIGSAL